MPLELSHQLKKSYSQIEAALIIAVKQVHKMIE